MAQQRITTDRLLAYAAGDLPTEDAQAVEAHLAHDPDAARTVAAYRLAAQHAAADDSVGPPAPTIDRAKGIPRSFTAPRRAAGWLSRLEAIVADVIFDSRVQLAAVRNDVVGTRVQLGFEANGVEIELQADRDDALGAQPWRVLGQVDADEKSESVRAEIVITPTGADDVVETTTTDDRGMFSASLADGRYDVYLRLAETALVLRDVDLR